MRACELLESIDYPITISRFDQLSQEQLQQIHQLIGAGGEVSSDAIAGGIQRSQLVAFAEDNGKVIAVTVMKTPLNSYKTSVFAKAGVPELANSYAYESGYSYTDPAYRSTGVSARLHRQLFQTAGEPLFATVRSDNRVALLGLQRLGFAPVGEPFASSRGDYTITLLIKK